MALTCNIITFPGPTGGDRCRLTGSFLTCLLPQVEAPIHLLASQFPGSTEPGVSTLHLRRADLLPL